MKALISANLFKTLPVGNYDVRDRKLVGFVLRVRANGKHAYFANYTRGKWMKLGDVAQLKPEQARELAWNAINDAKHGVDPLEAKRRAAPGASLKAFIEDEYEPWAVANRKRGAETVQRLHACFDRDLGDVALTELSAFAVERWRTARLKAGTTPATVNRDIGVLKAALAKAVEWKKLAVHPLADVKPARVDHRGVVRFLTADETARLHAALTARDDRRRQERESANEWRRARGYAEWRALGPYTDHLTPLTVLALNTGLRFGELTALTWQDVSVDRKILTVRGETSKTGQTRHVPLNDVAVTTLTTWKDNRTPQPDAYVFPGPAGERLVDIKTAWMKLLRDATITRFRFHDCRHDFASKLVMAGVDLNTVRELLGHADIKMVLRYAHLAHEHKAAAVAKLAAV